MPSPLGHALAGAAAGWAILPRIARRPGPGGCRQVWTEGAAFAVLGMLPDLDLLWIWANVHRGPTHSLTAALIVGLATLAVTRQRRVALACAVAYASHAVLDWLGSDSSAPIGIMALWPVTREYYESNIGLFSAISRRYWLPGAWAQNLRAVGWELLVLVPLAALALRWRAFERQPLQKVKQEKESRGA